MAAYGLGNGGVLVIHCGNLDAFAPQSQASFDAIGRGEFPDPFLPNAAVIDVPVRPDFVAAGDFDGDGHSDIVFAARNVPTLYILSGNGKSGFSAPQIVNLNGVVTALGVIPYHQGRFSSIFVGTTSTAGSVLNVFTGLDFGLAPVANVRLAGPLTSIAFGNLFREAGNDAALVADGQLFQVL